MPYTIRWTADESEFEPPRKKQRSKCLNEIFAKQRGLNLCCLKCFLNLFCPHSHFFVGFPGFEWLLHIDHFIWGLSWDDCYFGKPKNVKKDKPTKHIAGENDLIIINEEAGLVTWIWRTAWFRQLRWISGVAKKWNSHVTLSCLPLSVSLVS